MRGDGFRIVAIALFICLLPAYSNALIEEKSSVVGFISGASEKPLPGIKVRLLDSFFLVEVAKTVTDSNGKFTISDLLPGLYLVSVDLPSLSGMFKRVQVISGTPTFIDLRSILKEDDLKKHDAWDKFKWTIRVAERNPLRQEEALPGTAAVARFTSQNFTGALAAVGRSDIRTEISYMSVGTRPSGELWNTQMTAVGMEGKLRGAGSWSFNGHVLGGESFNYRASGDIEYQLWNHNVEASFSANDLVFALYPEAERQLITRFLGSATSRDLGDENKLWVTSVHLKDQWQMLPRLSVGYGTRIDYYGYLEESVSYSPRFQITYHLTPSWNVRTGYYRNQSAPGNYSIHKEETHPFMPVAFVPYDQKNLDPQTAQGYEVGVDYSTGETRVSVTYYTESIADKIATIDARNSNITDQLDENIPFLIFNASDIDSRGMELELSRKLNQNLTAVASYNLAQSTPVYILEKRYLGERQLFFRNGDGFNDYHDIRAGIEATVASTLTNFSADWKWSSGSPLVFGRVPSVSLSSVDVHLSQGVPVHLFSDAELRLMVAVKNLLDQNPSLNTNADFDRALLFAMPRSFAGGVLVKF